METREKQCQLAQVADPGACGGGPLIAEQGKVGRSAWEVMGGARVPPASASQRVMPKPRTSRRDGTSLLPDDLD